MVAPKIRKVQSKAVFNPDTYVPPKLDPQAKPEQEMFHLFSVIEGEGDKQTEVQYEIPKQVSRAQGLRAMEIASTGGEAAVTVWMLREMLGDEGYKIVSNGDYIDDDTFDKIVETVTEIVLGDSGKGRR